MLFELQIHLMFSGSDVRAADKLQEDVQMMNKGIVSFSFTLSSRDESELSLARVSPNNGLFKVVSVLPTCSQIKASLS